MMNEDKIFFGAYYDFVGKSRNSRLEEKWFNGVMNRQSFENEYCVPEIIYIIPKGHGDLFLAYF
jgi:hypothetical protein